MSEDKNNWKYKWSIKEFLPITIIGLAVAMFLIFRGGRYNGTKIAKFDGEWGSIVFMISATLLVLLVVGLLDFFRSRRKVNSRSDENGIHKS